MQLSLTQNDAAGLCGVVRACSGTVNVSAGAVSRQCGTGGPGSANATATSAACDQKILIAFESAAGAFSQGSWPAGNWTFRLNVVTPNPFLSTLRLSICRIDASCATVATVYDAPVSLPLTAAGVQSVTVAGAACSGAAGDRVYVTLSVANAVAASESLVFKPDQALDTPLSAPPAATLGAPVPLAAAAAPACKCCHKGGGTCNDCAGTCGVFFPCRFPNCWGFVWNGQGVTLAPTGECAWAGGGWTLTRQGDNFVLSGQGCTYSVSCALLVQVVCNNVYPCFMCPTFSGNCQPSLLLLCGICFGGVSPTCPSACICAAMAKQYVATLGGTPANGLCHECAFWANPVLVTAGGLPSCRGYSANLVICQGYLYPYSQVYFVWKACRRVFQLVYLTHPFGTSDQLEAVVYECPETAFFCLGTTTFTLASDTGPAECTGWPGTATLAPA